MNSNQQILFSHSIISPLGKQIHQATYRKVIFWSMGPIFFIGSLQCVKNDSVIFAKNC